MKTEYEKMIAGEPYRPQDEELRQLAARSRNFQYSFNKTFENVVLFLRNGLAQLVKIFQ